MQARAKWSCGLGRLAAGTSNLSFIIDPDDTMEEIREDNNRLDVQVNVTAPGVKLQTATPVQTLTSSSITTTSWNVSLTNTALSPPTLPCKPVRYCTLNRVRPCRGTSEAQNQISPWKVKPPNPSPLPCSSRPAAPGTYQIDLLALDVDNGVDYPLNLDLIVLDLPDADLA